MKVVWRCHIGVDEPNELARRAWDFLRPYVEPPTPTSSPAASTSGTASTQHEGLGDAAVDRSLLAEERGAGARTVEAILARDRARRRTAAGAPVFTRGDGSPGRVERPPSCSRRSRCRRRQAGRPGLPLGPAQGPATACCDCFAEHVADPAAHLVLAGPAEEAVADDPEGADVYAELAAAWRQLPGDRRRRAHLVTCRWTTSRRTGRWSTRSSAAPTCSCRRASPRASG